VNGLIDLGMCAQVYEVLYEGACDCIIATSLLTTLCLTGKDAGEKSKALMELPPIRELDLPLKTGKPAHLLMKKLGLEIAIESLADHS